MTGYIVRRLILCIPVLFLVGLIAFSLLHVVPADPAAIIAGDQASVEEYEQVRRQLGLDRPFIVQLGLFFNKLFHGDLGTSIFSKYALTKLMAPRLQATLSLAVFGTILSVAWGISFGILAAWKANTWVDRVVMVLSVLGYSIPLFCTGYILIFVFALKSSLFPVLGFTPFSEGIFPFVRSLALPAVTCAVVTGAIIARMTRSTMLEVLSEDYIRTARAKGLRERIVLVRHAFRCAAIPVVTIIGLQIAMMVTGLFVVEIVFGIPGLGRMTVDAMVRRDFPVIQGMLMIVAFAYVLVNLGIDIVYTLIDPRIRY